MHHSSGTRWVGQGMAALLAALVLLLPARLAWAQEPEPVPDDDAEAITQVLDAVLTAWEEGDVDSLAMYTAEPFLWIDTSATMFDREGWLAAAGGGEGFEVQEMAASNINMWMLADGVVQLTFDLDGTVTADDQQFSFFETDSVIFHLHDDGWMISFVQGTERGDDTEAYMVGQQAIAQAMSAAPSAVSAGATILGLPSDGSAEPVVLREGESDWICFTDDANTPIPDPYCLDATWQAAFEAAMTGEEAEISTVGIAYALQGAAIASATDPAATEPAEGEDWLIVGPSVLLLAPGGFDAEMFSTDPESGGPFILWDDTPMESLLVPVTLPAEGEVAADDEMVASALSAAPATVAAAATVLAPDEEGNLEAVVEGDNGWSCLPDDPTTPGPDPICVEGMWTDFIMAQMAGEEPDIAAPGVAYMLQGGWTASNTDPAALEPAEGEDWVVDAPHIMLVMPGGFDESAYSSDHMSGGPYIMWAGTPYEHMMIPVADAAGMTMDDTEGTEGTEGDGGG